MNPYWLIFHFDRSALARAESVNSQRLRAHTVKHMKPAIQGSGSTYRPAAPAAKVSNAQKAGFAESCVKDLSATQNRR